MNALLAIAIKLFPLIPHLKPPPAEWKNPADNLDLLSAFTVTFIEGTMTGLVPQTWLDHNMLAVRGNGQISSGALLGKALLSSKGEGHGVMQIERCVIKEEPGTIPNCPLHPLAQSTQAT